MTRYELASKAIIGARDGQEDFCAFEIVKAQKTENDSVLEAESDQESKNSWAPLTGQPSYVFGPALINGQALIRQAAPEQNTSEPSPSEQSCDEETADTADRGGSGGDNVSSLAASDKNTQEGENGSNDAERQERPDGASNDTPHDRPDASHVTDKNDELLAILADGMGGHIGGAYASETAVENFISSYQLAAGAPEQRLSQALEACNDAISQEVMLNQNLSGMGCTLIGALFNETGLRWVSVGDSLLYHYQDGKIYQLNEDHSLAPVLDMMVENGEISEEDAKNHPRRNSLLSALTGDEIDMIDLHDTIVPLGPKDWVIIASDGIQTLDNDEIAAVIDETKDKGAHDVVEALLKAIEERGYTYQDNATIMAVHPKPEN